MAIVKPFKGLRTPSQEVCEELACLPYDVMNSEEAAQMAAGKPRSLLHVTRAEIDCPAGTDIHSETVYNKSVENFNMFQEKGWLVQDEDAKFYIYAQTMDGRTQYGIVGCAACEDYITSGLSTARRPTNVWRNYLQRKFLTRMLLTDTIELLLLLVSVPSSNQRTRTTMVRKNIISSWLFTSRIIS